MSAISDSWRFRTVGYREYEIDTGAIEALNSVERRAAIETGQEQENVAITGQISAKSIALSKVLSMSELEAIEKKMLDAMEAEKQGKAIVGTTVGTGPQIPAGCRYRFAEIGRVLWVQTRQLRFAWVQRVWWLGKWPHSARVRL